MLNTSDAPNQHFKEIFIIVIMLLFFSLIGNIYLWQRLDSCKKLNIQLNKLTEGNKNLIESLQNFRPQFPPQQTENSTFIDTSPTPEDNLDTTTQTMGYITSVYDVGEKNYLTIDYIQWLSETNGTCTTSGSSSLPRCGPDGYSIINQSPLIRTFEIAPNTKIEMQSYGSGEGSIKFGEKIDYVTFKELFNPDSLSKVHMGNGNPPFNIEILNGKVTKITEQYIP